MPQPSQHPNTPHPPAPTSPITITLSDIFLHNTPASKAITTTLQTHSEWIETDRATFSTTIYDLVRHWRLLWFLQDQPPSFHDHDITRLLTTYHLYKKTITDPTLPSPLRPRLTEVDRTRAIRESIPDWLDVACLAELGPRWDSILHALNTPALQILRANTLKTTRAHLITTLNAEGVPTTPITWAPDALRVTTNTNVFHLQSFHQGFFETQDTASQMVSHFLDPKPGMRVLDACAGEGGKTLHLAALMKNTGRIIALDPSPAHLHELRRRATRAGADTIETRVLSSAKATKRLTGTIDRLLIDAPCSGLGTLQRNPDIKWKLTPESLDRLRTLQRQLLETYTPLVKPTGRFVYAVCSILPSEGEQLTADFLSEHPAFQCIREQRYWPDADGTDGFYMALLQRTE